MKKRTSDKFWFPFWVDKWIFGSIRIECTTAERGIWVDLLSLASKDDGHIRANEETPYPLQQLSGMLIIPEKELDAAINKFIKNKKLTRTKTGTLHVTKWDKYQFSDRHRIRMEGEMSQRNDIVSQKNDAIIYNNKVNNKTIKNIKPSSVSKKKPQKKKPKKETVKIKKDGKEIEVSFDEAFDYWYKSYPKHVNPKVALDKFKARCRQGQFNEVDQGLTGYLNYIINECSRRGIELKEFMPYVLYPQTFLNKERWKEYIGVKRIVNL